MSNKRSDKMLLMDMLESMEKIEFYSKGMSFETLKSNEMAFDAILRHLTVIGEAANKLSSSLMQHHDYINWHGIISFRNRLVHEYFGIDYNLVWEVISENLDEIKTHIQSILSNDLNIK